MRRNRKRVLTGLTAAVAVVFCVRCAPVSGTATETENITAMLYNPDGSPAVSAKVRFYRHDNNPRPGFGSGAVDSTYTDNNGNYSKKLDPDTFNILATLGTNATFQDSIIVTEGDTTRPPPDTLKSLGSISGKIELQGTDDPRTVFILFMGSNTFTRPTDSLGNFTAMNMAKGEYPVTLLTILDDYDVMDTSFTIRAGVDSILAAPLKLRYTGIPVPQGLRIEYDTMKQIVTLIWNKPTSGTQVQSYNIYRKHQDSASFERIKSGVTDTTYNDSAGIQDVTYEYRVAAVDTSTTEGTRSAAAIVTEVSAFGLLQNINLDSLNNNPISFVVNTDTTLYVAYNGGNNNSFVGVFDKIGRNIDIIGAGKYVQLYDVALDSRGNVYTVDPDRSFVVKFNALGDSISQWNVQRPVRILVDGNDNLFVLHNYNPYLISKFDTMGNIIATDTAVSSSTDYAMVIDSGGRVFIKEGYTNRLLAYDNSLAVKSYASFTLYGEYSLLLAIDSFGKFYVAGDNNDYNKISVYNSTGEKIAQWRPGVPFDRIFLLGNRIYVLGSNQAVNEIIRVFLAPF